MKGYQVAYVATLSLALQTANASETFDSKPIDSNSPDIRKLCHDMQNKTGLLLDGQEICEISTDKGRTWTLLEEFLAAGGLLIGAGAPAYMIRRRKKKGIIKESTNGANSNESKEAKNPIVEEILENQRLLKELIVGKIQTLKKKGDELEINGSTVTRVHKGYKITSVEKETLYFYTIDQVYDQLSISFGDIVNQITFLAQLDTPEITARFSKLAGNEIENTGIRMVRNGENRFDFERVNRSTGVWSSVNLKKMLEELPSNFSEVATFEKERREKLLQVFRTILYAKGG